MVGVCQGCEEECTAIIIDQGIGHYEYWGATGIDTQLEVVSDCCHEEVITEDGREITVQEIQNSYIEI